MFSQTSIRISASEFFGTIRWFILEGGRRVDAKNGEQTVFRIIFLVFTRREEEVKKSRKKKKRTACFRPAESGILLPCA